LRSSSTSAGLGSSSGASGDDTMAGAIGIDARFRRISDDDPTAERARLG
jgi:hypothetical protein